MLCLGTISEIILVPLISVITKNTVTSYLIIIRKDKIFFNEQTKPKEFPIHSKEIFPLRNADERKEMDHIIDEIIKHTDLSYAKRKTCICFSEHNITSISGEIVDRCQKLNSKEVNFNDLKGFLTEQQMPKSHFELGSLFAIVDVVCLKEVNFVFLSL